MRSGNRHRLIEVSAMFRGTLDSVRGRQRDLPCGQDPQAGVGSVDA